MLDPKPKTMKLRCSYRAVVVSALFALAVFAILQDDVRDYYAPQLHGGIFRTRIPRKLLLAQNGLEKHHALVKATNGKCENLACKAPNPDEPIPKIIWMFWDEGFESTPQPEKRSYDSWVQYNPTWEVRGMNLKEAEELTKVHEEGSDGYLPDKVWQSMSIQSMSDYIRISILHHYGGVWADASLFCNEPLDSWIDLDRDYLLLLRDEMRPDNWRRIYPWYTSWWMAASKGSHTAELIFNDVMHFLRNDGKSQREYFWFHRIVAVLWNTNKSFVAAIGPTESAMGPHCRGGQSIVDQHMFKRCGRALVNEPFNLISEHAWKKKKKSRIYF